MPLSAPIRLCSMSPLLGAALIAAVAGLVVSIVGLIPNLGRLRRLERVVSILEKVEEKKARDPLLAMRDRLIRGLEVRPVERGRFYVAGLISSIGGIVLLLVASWLFRMFPSPAFVIAVTVVILAYFVTWVSWIISSIVRMVRTQ